MRANRLFWPMVLIVLGLLFLLDNLKIITVSIWSLLIPILLILGGLSALFGSIGRGRRGETIGLSIPLEGGENARLKVSYGAGKLVIGGGAAAGQLLTGTFAGGVDHDARRSGGGMDVKLSGPSDFASVPWWGWDGGERTWDVKLNGSVPLSLDVEVGAAESRIDLTDVRVSDLKVQTGASDTKVWMPARAGQTRAKISGGVASININIPTEVAARIEAEGGLSSIDVDANRFPREGKYYQSPGYETAANKIDMKIEMGVGSIRVR